MSCNTCKSKSKESNKMSSSEPAESKYYFVKIPIFLIASAILIPFIIPILIIVLFKVIVLGHGVDITPLLRYLGKKIIPKDKDAEEEEDDEESEYELENPHDLVIIKKQ